MSQLAVENVVLRSTNDEQFVSAFLADPEQALSSYDLTHEEKEILKSMDQERILRASGRETDVKYCVVATVSRV